MVSKKKLALTLQESLTVPAHPTSESPVSGLGILTPRTTPPPSSDSLSNDELLPPALTDLGTPRGLAVSELSPRVPSASNLGIPRPRTASPPSSEPLSNEPPVPEMLLSLDAPNALVEKVPSQCVRDAIPTPRRAPRGNGILDDQPPAPHSLDRDWRGRDDDRGNSDEGNHQNGAGDDGGEKGEGNSDDRDDDHDEGETPENGDGEEEDEKDKDEEDEEDQAEDADKDEEGRQRKRPKKRRTNRQVHPGEDDLPAGRVRLPAATIVATGTGKCPRGSNGKVWKSVDSGGYGNHSPQTRTLLGNDMSGAPMLLDASIPSLLWQLQKSNNNRTAESFLNMLNLIRLAIRTECIRDELAAQDTHTSGKRKRREPCINEVFAHVCKTSELGIKTGTFQDWVHKGRKYASMGAAGSMYLLWMVAGSQGTSATTNLLEQDVSDFCDLIEAPNEATPLGRSIARTVIPALTATRKRHPIILRGIFPPNFLQPGDSEDLDCTDLLTTQRMFSRLKLHQFHASPRDERHWHTFLNDPIPSKNLVDIYAANARALGLDCVVPPPPEWRDAQEALLDTVATTNSPSCTVLPSGYRHDKKYRRINMNYNLRKKTTRSERIIAQKAEVIENLDDLRQRLLDFYTDSGLKASNKYLYVPYERVQPDSKSLLVQSAEGKLLFLRSTLSSYLKENLMAKLTAIFGELKERTEKEVWEWSSIHFDYYNRYNTHGNDAPVDIHPNFLTKEDMKLFPREYSQLQELFKGVFEEVRLELERLLPQESRIESIFARFLPGGEPSPIFPFSGIVVNLNVQTTIHTDSEDVLMCLVLPIGEFTGGDLCFKDLGLRIELRHGDWVVFDSKKLSHFNMPYEGKRASFVMHSDSAGEFWVEDRNGWKDNANFAS
ncbi:hypothetical protein ONZ45_g9339 [Pleurotus djamor]|nr:hypothetical protein ONZ45_g9339 [Pleurotus djamor]